jgi:hypothetical protein
MSTPPLRGRTGRAGIALAVAAACVAFPAAAPAAPVNLGTAGSFVALGGTTVTNTGPSVLNGDLGVSPGTSLVGFTLPAVVNGATHANDAVASQAQLDLTTAYDVAAGQPAGSLTGLDLGNRTLTPGAYKYTSSAQLTGALTLDAQGDPNAQFVFEIGSTLTTASASSVTMINGASPCNVYWQVGSSATLGSTTAFQGNVMALTDITLNNNATVQGRVLARNGQIRLDDNVLNRPTCATGSSGSGGTTGGSGSSGSGSSGSGSSGSGAGSGTSGTGPATTSGTAPTGTGVTRDGTATIHRGRPSACTDGFRASVRGKMIRRVVFKLDGTRLANDSKSPFAVYVRATQGRHKLSADITFKDATRAVTRSFKYSACAAASLRPRHGQARFTG